MGVAGFSNIIESFLLINYEIAVKMMKDNKSKEFFAELKVMCKVHHMNMIELIGYAAGEDHLYLVYEYVQNGSLSEHLHDPLLKVCRSVFYNVCIMIQPNKEHLSCSEQMRKAFKSADVESSLEKIIDPSLKDNYPIEEVCKVWKILVGQRGLWLQIFNNWYKTA
uniref:Putative LRR receptor-like serine/threonine-protein kinase n=1 Tax=Aegilops tauschii TaxID=37682 RepID=R7WDX9_AEGTA